MEPLIFIGFIVLMVAILVGGLFAAAARKKALREWAGLHGLHFRDTKDRGMDDRYPAFKGLHKGSGRYAYNIMEGIWRDRPVTAFDYHYETHSTDSKGRRKTQHHRFSAAIIASDLPLKSLYIRPEGFFDKVTEFFGMDDIDFESADFSRKFYVKADDKRWAYDVLHPRTMQYLLDHPRFTIELDRSSVIVYRGSTFKPDDFSSAADVACALLEGFPEYLIRQLQEQNA